MPPQPPKKTPSLSPEVVRDLKKILGAEATEIIPALETLLETFPHFEKSLKTDTLRLQLERHIGPLQELVKAIRAVQDDLEGLAPEEQPPWRDTLDRLFVQVVIHTGTLDYLFNYPKAKGRRRNEARRWLANNVAFILRCRGIRLARTHGGGRRGSVFHKALEVVIEAAEGQSPEDLFPLLRATADIFDHFTQAQLDEIYPEAGFFRLPRSGVVTRP